jgi:hypothetical protein
MARRSRPSQRSAVPDTVKDEPRCGGLTAILDGACARRSLRLRSGRNGVRGRTKERDFKEGVKSKGFRAGQDTGLPEARSRRRDDGSGQAENIMDGTDHA